MKEDGGTESSISSFNSRYAQPANMDTTSRIQVAAQRDVAHLTPMRALTRVVKQHPTFLPILLRHLVIGESPQTWERACNVLLEWLTRAAGIDWEESSMSVVVELGALPPTANQSSSNAGASATEARKDERKFIAATGKQNGRLTIWVNPDIVNEAFDKSVGHTPVDGVGHFTLVLLHEVGHILHNSPAAAFYYRELWTDVLGAKMASACEQASDAAAGTSFPTLGELKRLQDAVRDAGERLADVFSHQIAKCAIDECDF